LDFTFVDVCFFFFFCWGGGIVGAPALRETFYFDVEVFSVGITTHKPRQEVAFLFFPIDFHL
jgi:hypothetical protein